MAKTRNVRPVVIAGGGIGGLACALALALKGFQALVLEQAHEFGEIGAGIQLAPNAWSALDALKVGEDVKREAVFIERLLMMDGLSGETVIEIPLDAPFRERYGNPYAVTHRADIHRSLLDACKARADALELRTHSRVTGFDLESGGVSVMLADGARIAAAALIGADGWRSAVRESIVGDGEPPMSGHMCYRAVLAAEDMPRALRWPAATLWAGPNTHVVHYPLRGWKLFNLVATVVREHAGSGHNEEAPPEEVLPLFARNCDTPLSLLRVPRAFRRWMLRFREPVENWSRGPVTLLGDAAHLMLQYFAQGAAMAMEDAIALAAAADAADGAFAAAFQRYQTLRLVRASRVQISSRMLGLLYHADGVSRLVRNDIYRDRPAERYYDALDWIFTAPDYVRTFR
jgi:salicylate hydroxylase